MLLGQTEGTGITDMIKPIAIQLREQNSVHRADEPLRFGVPLPQGVLNDVNRLQLSGSDHTLFPTQCRPLAHWPDGSVRWVCVETLYPAPDKPPCGLILSEGAPESQVSATVTRSSEQLQVSFGDYQLTVNPGDLNWQWDGPGGQRFLSRLRLDDQSDKACSAKLDDHWQIKSNGPVVTVLMARGWWHDSRADKLARFRCELSFYTSGLVTVEATIHNPRRAKHPGGLWDLGDPGSVHFGGMVLETDVNRSERHRLILSADQPPREFSADQCLSLHQESSGGENWNSRNHINAEGQILPRYRGYRLQHGHHEPEWGLRANPIIETRTAESIVSVSLPHFWQNFPSALEADDTAVRAWLFPADKQEAYELQGGERKTQRVIMGYGIPLEKLAWSHSPLVPSLPPEHYKATKAFPWFNPTAKDDSLQSLIQLGLDGPNNFFHKREVIDEFGWRNFGELFADHETLYQQPGEPPFISHYNNQYDPVYGFARQFALTGDPRWYELMTDLARHVIDIDIYHTDEDRVEYNNGLFWHTDHYLDAHTATHRTFSKHNNTSSTPGQTGGGPAEEHCYSTGLLYHYLMTGSEDSRDAVMDLTVWIENQREGDSTLLGQIDIIRRRDIPALKKAFKGMNSAYRQYPFTRGTGNYLNTLLDAAELQPNGPWLAKAARIIQATVHPSDDPNDRNLFEVEASWSYLVFLTSLSRFIWLKRLFRNDDRDLDYAMAAFERYSQWICQNERPFLERPDQLEFPNDTWVAQDIRKAALLYHASAYYPNLAANFYSCAEGWRTYVAKCLNESPEKTYTRVMVILAQNHGPHMFTREEISHLLPAKFPNEREIKQFNWRNMKQPPIKIVSRVWLRLSRVVLNFNFRKEFLWLEFRLKQ